MPDSDTPCTLAQCSSAGWCKLTSMSEFLTQLAGATQLLYLAVKKA